MSKKEASVSNHCLPPRLHKYWVSLSNVLKVIVSKSEFHVQLSVGILCVVPLSLLSQNGHQSLSNNANMLPAVRDDVGFSTQMWAACLLALKWWTLQLWQWNRHTITGHWFARKPSGMEGRRKGLMVGWIDEWMKGRRDTHYIGRGVTVILGASPRCVWHKLVGSVGRVSHFVSCLSSL